MTFTTCSNSCNCVNGRKVSKLCKGQKGSLIKSRRKETKIIKQSLFHVFCFSRRIIIVCSHMIWIIHFYYYARPVGTHSFTNCAYVVTNIHVLLDLSRICSWVWFSSSSVRAPNKPTDHHCMKTIPGFGTLFQSESWKIWLYIYRERKWEKKEIFQKSEEMIGSVGSLGIPEWFELEGTLKPIHAP